MIKVSVIIPVYNIEPYIDKCIQSVITQTLTDIEILIINDGSTDNSKKKCEEYEKIDKRIKVIEKPNGGLSSARNTGLIYAKGEYISLIDGDDYIDKDMLEILYSNARKYNADIVECGARWVYPEAIKYVASTEKIICNNIESLTYFLESKCFTAVAWNKIYRRNLFDNITYPVGCIHEDIATTYKLLYKSKILVSIPDCKYNYLQRQGSISGYSFGKKHLDALVFWKNIYDFICEIGDENLTQLAYKKLITFDLAWYIRAVRSANIEKQLLTEIENEIKNNYSLIKNYDVDFRIKFAIKLIIIKPEIFRCLIKIYNIKKRFRR